MPEIGTQSNGLSEHLEEQIVVGMFDRGLLGFPPGGIELKSGRISPYYYNMRGSLSFNKQLDTSGQMTIEQQSDFRRALAAGYAARFFEIKHPIDHIFGKAQAATAPAAVAAYEAGMSYIWERVDEPHKTYGHHQKIEGDAHPGDTVLMADDVTTDGKSKLEGAEVLTAAGLLPLAITLQFDREEGGAQFLQGQHGYEVNAITTLSNAARFLLDNGRIGNQAIDALHTYHEGLASEGLTTTFSLPRS
jgi:uridine monophosphate synthetase